MLRSQLKKQPIAHYKTIDKYCEQRVNKIIKYQLTNFNEKAIELIDGWSKKNKQRTADLFALLLFNVDIYFLLLTMKTFSPTVEGDT